MTRDITVWQFASRDANPIGRHIADNPLLDNVHDYGEAVVNELARFFSPGLPLSYACGGDRIVAESSSGIVGTATLDDHRVRNVFVSIDHHGDGAGTILMGCIEEPAGRQGETFILTFISGYARERGSRTEDVA